jgi:hypothetical protein
MVINVSSLAVLAVGGSLVLAGRLTMGAMLSVNGECQSMNLIFASTLLGRQNLAAAVMGWSVDACGMVQQCTTLSWRSAWPSWRARSATLATPSPRYSGARCCLNAHAKLTSGHACKDISVLLWKLLSCCRSCARNCARQKPCADGVVDTMSSCSVASRPQACAVMQASLPHDCAG